MNLRNRPLEVDRSSLATRLMQEGGFVLVVAPAGYGKSRLARALIRHYAGVVCDLNGVGEAAQLSRRIVAALLTGGLPDSGGYANALAALPGTSETAQTWSRLAASAWLDAGGPDCVVFENAESIEQDSTLIAAIASMASLDADRRVVVCSRVPLETEAYDDLPHGPPMRVGPAELAFTIDESVNLIGSAGASAEQARSAAELARGWPVAALLFAGKAANGTLEDALLRAGDIADLRSYVESQVFGDLDSDTLAILGSLALLGTVDAKALAALNLSEDDVSRHSRNHPFFAIADGTVHVHLIARAALKRMGVGIAPLLDAAKVRSASDPTLSARFFVSAGELDAAAELLGTALAPLLLGNIPSEVAELVDEIGPEVLQRHPAAWSATMTSRAYAKPTEGMLAEARVAWSYVGERAPAAEIFGAATGNLNWAIFLNRTEEVAATFELLDARLANEPPESPFPLLARLWKTWVGLRAGKRVDVERVELEMAPLLAASHELVSAFEYCIRALVAAHDFDLPNMRAAMDKAMAAAIAARAAVYTVLSAQHAAFYAWLGGDTDYVNKCVACLEEHRSPISDPGTLYFIECLAGDPAAAVIRNELPTVRAQASLIGASRVASPADRLRLAERALEAAQIDGSALIMTVAWLGIALVDLRRRTEALERALEHAQRIEGGLWTRAVEALRDQRHGALDAFAANFSGAPAPRGDGPMLRSWDRALLTGGTSIVLAAREWEVLLALVYVGRDVEAPRLAAMLLPDSDPSDGARSVRVWIYRLRARLGGSDLIESTSAGYRLARPLQTDIDVCLEILERRDRGAQMNDWERTLLSATVSHAEAAQGNLAAEWAAPYRRKLQDIRERFERLG